MEKFTIKSHGFGCACCGKPLKIGDRVIVCPDCGGMFCDDCEDGFESHECEPDDK